MSTACEWRSLSEFHSINRFAISLNILEPYAALSRKTTILKYTAIVEGVRYEYVDKNVVVDQHKLVDSGM